MRLQYKISTFLTALLLPGTLAAHIAGAASSPEDQPFSRLMAHSMEVGGERVSYFVYRPATLRFDASGPVLLVPSEGQLGALALAEGTQLFEIAEAQGALLVLIEWSLLRDRRVLDRVLGELTDEVG
jgi:hypothetical protein